jgi:RNA polymerase sigma-70 factor, ECF subfamily
MPVVPTAPITDLTPPSAWSSEDSCGLSADRNEVLRLFDSAGPGLRRYVRSLGLPPEAVEDVLQEVFLALFHHLQRGRSRSNLRGWLYRVSQHLALKQRARLARQRRLEAVLDPGVADAVVDQTADAEQQLLNTARTRRLRAVFRALSERERQCLALRAEGLRYREIARLLEVSLGTVAKAVARAVTRMARAEAGDQHVR